MTSASGDLHLGRSSRTLGHTLAAVAVAEITLWCVLILGTGLFHNGPDGKSLSTDFAVFSGAAQALAHGTNPYDNVVLYSWEHRLLAHQHLAVTTVVGNVRAGNPPLMYWAIEPLTALPYRDAATIWMSLMFAFTVAGFLATCAYLKVRRPVLAGVVFMLLPQTVLGICYANVHGVILCALACALLFARGHPGLAGTISALCWLKPQIALPLLLLIVLFQVTQRRRFLGAFAATSAVGVLASSLVLGVTPFVWWLHGLVAWSGSEGLEPNLSSLVGLYAGWAPGGLRTTFTVAGLVLASTLTLNQWRRLGGRIDPDLRHTAWLWFVWFLAAPFAHFPDEVVLLPALMAYLTNQARRRTAQALVWVTFASVLLFPATLGSVNLLSVVVAGALVPLFRASRANAVPALPGDSREELVA